MLAVAAEPAEVAYVALATVPVTLAPATALARSATLACKALVTLPVILPVTLPMKFTAVMLPLTLNAVNIPTLVMFGCAFVVTVPAVAANCMFDI